MYKETKFLLIELREWWEDIYYIIPNTCKVFLKRYYCKKETKSIFQCYVSILSRKYNDLYVNMQLIVNCFLILL